MRVLAILATVAIAGAGAAVCGCGGHESSAKPAAAVREAIDTTPVDLSQVKTALPPAAPDTFTPPPPRPAKAEAEYAAAPPPLMASVNRESGFSRFCFEEYGEKLDPSLHGGVAILVTVGAAGVTDAKVANSTWSAKDAGARVDQCLNEKAKEAWKLGPGEVQAGRYVVHMSFRGA